MQFLALSVDNLLRGLWAALCQFLYWLVAWLYELFMNISRVEILTGNDIKPIYQRITMILTIIMVFYVTFEAVKYVLQPEQFTDKEKGGSKLVLKMVLVVVMIAFVPQIFSWAYKFQNVVFDNQVFSKVILGKQEVDTQKFGRVFSANILGMFYYADEDAWGQDAIENENNCEGIPCKNVVNINLNSLVEYGELPLMQLGLNETGKKKEEGTGKGIDRYYIHFDGLFAVAVGGFMAFMLILYCVDAGVRVAQLAFLQIIAPIPIIGYLSPKKDGIFQKWVKQCTTTYLDLFLRVGLIYFVLLICQILSDAYNSGTLLNNIVGEESTTMKVFIYIALILGLLLFAKKAPEMLKELFPKSGAASGNFGLKAGERIKPTMDAIKGIGKGFNATKRVVGGAAGAIAGAAIGARTGRLITGAVKGAKAGGAKKGGLIGNVRTGVGQVRSDVEKDLDVKAAGGSIYGSRFFSGHYQSKAKEQDRTVKSYQDGKKYKENIYSATNSVSGVSSLKARHEAVKSGGGTEDQINAAEKTYKSARKAVNVAVAEEIINARKAGREVDFSKIGNITYDTKDANGKSNGTATLDVSKDVEYMKMIAAEIESTMNDVKGKDIGKMEIEIDSIDANGNAIKKKIKVEDMDELQLAKHIGDIEDVGETKAREIKATEEYKKAHSNASGSNSSK